MERVDNKATMFVILDPPVKMILAARIVDGVVSLRQHTHLSIT